MSSLDIPQVNFSGLDLSKVGTEEWLLARGQVMKALETHGFFSVVFNKVPDETLDALFGPLADDLFSLPLETKMLTTSDKFYQGYIPKRPGSNFESLNIDMVDASPLDSIQRFVSLMWPHGNPTFRGMMWSFAREALELEMMVRRMVVEGLGVEKHFDESMVKSTVQSVRMFDYGAPSDQEKMMAMGSHQDMNIMTFIYQHHSDGLELQDKSGRWFRSSPNSFSIMIGESFEAWSNGRLKATPHRVKMGSNNETRRSIGFGSAFKDECKIHAPEDLVTEDHPLLYKPYHYDAYVQFRFSDAAKGSACPLKAYCGVLRGDEMVA
ncbi:hypothetical protein J5N97_015697 [Dioscorea zingiberensis]|uniref:Fe2OG dioxygenase domain-containing protein n=1 Tax=Dioscorea zingiberensis TaxID=325984 RepID=A0A9D5CI61_9LILI|nr:hypothetical protein J5N97_015697 [Dioscorea zingiberensis]